MEDVEATWRSCLGCVSCLFGAVINACHLVGEPISSCIEHIHSSYHHIDIKCPFRLFYTTPHQPYHITTQLMDLSHQEESRGSSSPEAQIVRLKTEPGTSTKQSPRPSSSSNATSAAGSSNRPVQPPKVCDKCRLRSESCPQFRSDSTYPERMA